MTQVLAYSDLKPGTFFVNTSDGTLHMWPPAGVDPSPARLLKSPLARKRSAIVGRSNVVLRGLVFEHAASCINTSGATVTSSTNVLIDSVQANLEQLGRARHFVFDKSHGAELELAAITEVSASREQGIRPLSISNNETDYNNWRGAQGTFYDWASGGAKFFQMRTTTVQGHHSYNNQAQGLWFDTDNQNITINNATLVGSHNAGTPTRAQRRPHHPSEQPSLLKRSGCERTNHAGTDRQ